MTMWLNWKDEELLIDYLWNTEGWQMALNVMNSWKIAHTNVSAEDFMKGRPSYHRDVVRDFVQYLRQYNFDDLHMVFETSGMTWGC